jgi:hypothetical protein
LMDDRLQEKKAATGNHMGANLAAA